MMAEEESPYFRVYGFEVGRVLSPRDVADIHTVLKEFDNEIQDNTDLYHKARQQVLFEIGGDQLVNAAMAADDAWCEKMVNKAMKVYRDRIASASLPDGDSNHG